MKLPILRKILLASAIVLSVLGAHPETARSADYVVYSVIRGLDMGDTPGAVPLRDYYVNLGSNEGVREGTVLEVVRKLATYDQLAEKLYKEVSFPIARIKVIHAEPHAAVARLEKLLPADKMPIVRNYAVMVGDSVRFAQ